MNLRPLGLLFFVLFTGALLHAQEFDLANTHSPVLSLDGLWRFHTGDDPAWSSTKFDDSTWELLRSDENWAEQGHAGYSGIAWYRFKVDLPAGMNRVSLSLPYILTSYQVYANGYLIGSYGTMPPRAVPYWGGGWFHPYQLPSAVENQQHVEIAIRVWHWPGWSDDFGGGPSEGGALIGDQDKIQSRDSVSSRAHHWDLSSTMILALLQTLAAIGALSLFLLRRSEKGIRMSSSHESSRSKFALSLRSFAMEEIRRRANGTRASCPFRKIAVVFVVVAALSRGSLAAAQASTFMRYPNTFGDKIVFEAHDNLWLASLHGGTATQLTQGLSHDLLPRFSPDGKWIAFTRINQRSEDVYVLPSDGGTPRRLTFRSSRAGGPGPTFSADDNLVVTWSPDSSSIIFLARRQAFNWSDLSLYSVPVAGGLPTLLPLHPSGWMSYGPDRHTVAFTRSFTSFQSRKHYEGGLAPDVFTYDFVSKRLVQITDWKGTDDLPMWAGQKIYFTSDRGTGGRANLWVYDLQTKSTRQVTHFKDYDVDMPSLGKGSISFQQGGSLYTLSLADENLRKLQVSVPDDGAQTVNRVVKTGSMFSDADHGGTNYSLSPNGDFAIMSSRGDLYRLFPGGATSVNLTHTSDADESHPAISPDGSLVAYLTDHTGEQQLALLPVGGGQEHLLHFHGGFLHTPTWAPDGKALLVANSSNQLWWLPADGTTPHLIAQDPKSPILDATFSPDSRWIVYSMIGATEQHSLHLYDLAAGKDHALSASQSSDHHPVFSADGRGLIFLSDRNPLVVRSSAETNFATLKTSSLFVAPLYPDETFSGTNLPVAGQTYEIEHIMSRVTPLGPTLRM